MTDEQHFLPGWWAYSLLNAAEEVSGKNGVEALLRMAGLEHYIAQYPPPTGDRIFPFEHNARYLQALCVDMFGARRGGRVFGPRLGAFFIDALWKTDGPIRLADPAADPGEILESFAALCNAQTDQVVSVEGRWLWSVSRCSECWKRELNMPACFFTLGMLDRLVNPATEKRYAVTEVECFALGNSRCAFVIEPVGNSV